MTTERGGYNQLKIEVYQGLSTTPRLDTNEDLARAEGITFESQYPGGIFSSAEFFCKRDPTAAWSFAGNDRLVIRNGQEIAWEGTVGGIGYVAGAGAEQGRRVYGTGWWGTIAQRRGLNKPWADNRVSEDVWRTTASPYNVNDQTGAKGSWDRLQRLRYTPKAVSWANNHLERVTYTAPTGASVKRITFTDELAEGAQAWEFRLLNMTAASVIYTRTSSGSSTRDETLATPSQAVFFVYNALAACTPAADGTIYGAACNLMVYTETETITACVIANDVASAISTISSDRSGIGTLSLTLEPFITDGYEMAAPVLLRAAGFGDSAGSPWAAYFDHSETAQTPDGKPVLNLAVYPALDDYDYSVRLDDPNLVAPLEIVKSTDDIYNWIVVRYRDELNNRDVYVTPDDDASLKDATSITDWGQREYVLNAGLSASANAVDLGQRYLAARKDPRFYVAGPITVVGYIRAKNGNPVPSSLIRAGKRLRVENFLVDEIGVSGAGLTFLVSATRYTDSDEHCQISTGVPDNLAVLIAQLAAGI